MEPSVPSMRMWRHGCVPREHTRITTFARGYSMIVSEWVFAHSGSPGAGLIIEYVLSGMSSSKIGMAHSIAWQASRYAVPPG